MIQVIYGKRGSGKSKKMVSLANEQAKTAKGNVVFVDDDSRAIHELDRDIRFINADEYALTDYRSIYGFLCGIIATNYDVTTIFVDGLLNGMDKKSESSDKIFEKLQMLFADVCHKSRIRICNLAEIFNLSEMIASYFQHTYLMTLVQIQQRHWKSEMIVEISFSLQHNVFLR